MVQYAFGILICCEYAVGSAQTCFAGLLPQECGVEVFIGEWLREQVRECGR